MYIYKEIHFFFGYPDTAFFYMLILENIGSKNKQFL